MTANVSSVGRHGGRIAALALSLAFNAAVVFYIFHIRFQGWAAPEKYLEIMLERPPEPPPQKKPPPEVKKKVPRISSRLSHAASQRMAKPEQKVAAAIDPGPPVHFLDPSGEITEGSGDIGGGQKGSATQRGTERQGMHAPSDYAEKVKSRIISAKIYPVEALTKSQECIVAYTVTVDRNGNLLSYNIDQCGHELLDQASRNAILQGAPFPAPPDMGAERYDIHGILIFRLK